MRRIGAHVSIGKGLIAVLEKAQNMGANCIQIFSSPPQSFMPPRFVDKECAEFKKKAKELDIQPIFIHATYLINLASDKETLRTLSIKSLVDDMIFANKIGAKGVIVHTGSHKGKGFEIVLSTIKDSIQKILNNSPESAKLYLEVASGGAGKVGSTWEELKSMRQAVESPRVGLCLDTAHLFAGGCDFDTPDKIAKLSRAIETTIGWNEVEVLHVNDSKAAFGSFLDRHENLGEGFIGKQALRLLLNAPHFDKLPLIIETPGFDDKGPDKKNLDILKYIIFF